MGALWVLGLVGLVLGGVEGFEGGWNVSTVESLDAYRMSGSGLMVGLSLIKSAAAKGAVCLDGSPPAYHLHRGYGSGARNWLVHLEGGGWCNNKRTCLYRKGTNHGSSYHMEKEIPFVGILSNKPEENPDFYSWNRVKVRYCDGASFSGEGHYQDGNLFFRGQRIWAAAMEELMAQGMRYAGLALLSGCSAGGLSTILHCDDFRSMFPGHTRVKCVADAGYFLDVVDVAGIRAMRNLFEGVVSLQGVAKNLPRSCTSRMHPALCFFPQNLVDHVQTPLFLLNAAYDFWQVLESIVPPSADPHGQWTACKRRLGSCSPSQISVFQDFRNHMLNSLKGFSHNRKNGLYLNSCFAHCQSEIQETWYSNNSPRLHYMRIAQAVGNWYFDRSDFRAFDCPYPCDRTCHNIN